MKLLIILMLAALPLFCSAGSGCQLIYNLMNQTLDKSVNPDEYTNIYQSFLKSDNEEKALQSITLCYYKQPEEILNQVRLMMNAIYTSDECVNYSP